jgi:hypothetical protein
MESVKTSASATSKNASRAGKLLPTSGGSHCDLGWKVGGIGFMPTKGKTANAPLFGPVSRKTLLVRAIKNRLRYGRHAPKPNEVIWVPISKNLCAFKGSDGNRRTTGQVLQGHWPWPVVNVLQIPKIAACLAHWEKGVSWEESGIIELMRQTAEKRGRADSCRTLAEIRSRYELLDSIYDQVKRTGRLDPPLANHWNSRCLLDGILFHIDGEGSPIFGEGGCHRLAMALSLGHEFVPAVLGLVHPNAIGSLKIYRRLP